MEQTLTLTRIDRYTTDPAGKPLINKNNKLYESVRIRTQEHGDKQLSGFGGAWNRDWKEGDKVTVMVVEGKPDKNGNPYLNFSKVDKEAVLEGRISLLEAFIKVTLVPHIKNLDTRLKLVEPEKPVMPTKVMGTDITYPTAEDEGIDNDEPPF